MLLFIHKYFMQKDKQALLGIWIQLKVRRKYCYLFRVQNILQNYNWFLSLRTIRKVYAWFNHVEWKFKMKTTLVLFFKPTVLSFSILAVTTTTPPPSRQSTQSISTKSPFHNQLKIVISHIISCQQKWTFHISTQLF